MKRLMRMIKAIIALLIVFTNDVSFGQGIDSVRLAITDELKRNFNELKSDELDAPAYISYSVKDYKTFVVTASLGGILSSDQNHTRSSNSRVLVGSYDFNDESLQENTVEPYYTPNDMEIPLEDDYDGIRKALWLATDKVYKTAGEIYNRHKANLKEKEKSIEEVPHLKFYKAKPVVITDIQKTEKVDTKKLEQNIAKLSEGFLKYSRLNASSVTLTVQNETSYFANSEGTDIKITEQIASIFIRAALQDENGTYIFDQRRFSSDEINKLFTENDFDKIMEDLYQDLIRKESASKLAESYEGPVLFMDETVTDIFGNILGEFYPEPPKSEDNKFGSEFENLNSLENKIGKKTMSENLTIKLKPGLKSYDGQKLLGAIKVDAEGIVPDEEIVLVDKGVVKNLMTNRNYKKDDFKPNGAGQSPGVVDIEIKSKDKSFEDLKKRMLEVVKEEGLEYGLIIRNSNNLRMLDVYKVFPSGKEELYTNAFINDFDIKTLRKVIGATKTKNIYNKLNNSGFVSYIVPSAVLIEEVEVEPVRMSPFKLDIPLVENPVKAISEEN